MTDSLKKDYRHSRRGRQKMAFFRRKKAKATARKEEREAPEEKKADSGQKILTAEGWKRLMMRGERKAKQ
ncbi:MAG: hypothetical protein A3G30_04055 [Chlamydiae bacterium RIFCSPLOWO2_12_FULL_49_12]|nr:MAG: hypothetical protein A3G30_04055 [Chlamydiae bacterium RIFCSPLOWO2_12_FULL_49_12]